MRERVIMLKGPVREPSAVPEMPEGLAREEAVIVYPPVPPEAGAEEGPIAWWLVQQAHKDKRFWILSSGERHPRATWTNEPPPGPAWGSGKGRGLDALPETITIQLDREYKRLPDIFSPMYIPVISKRLLDLFMAADQNAVVAKQVDLRKKDGSPWPEPYFVFDVIRCENVVDWANSVIIYDGPYLRGVECMPTRVRCVSTALIRPDVNADMPILRSLRPDTGAASSDILVSDKLKSILEAENPKLTNVSFWRISSGVL